MARRHNCLQSKGKSLLLGFVIPALAASMLVGALVLPDAADACKHHHVRRDPRPTKAKVKGRWEVKLKLYYKYYSFRGSNYRLQNLFVFTKDGKLADFVHKQGNTPSFWRAVRRAAQKFTCADLLQGKRLVTLERGLANAIAGYYHAKTKRRARKMDLMVGVSQYYRSYCNPPKQPPRSKHVQRIH